MYNNQFFSSVLLLLFLLFHSCKESKEINTDSEKAPSEEKLFALVPSSESGLNFVNELEETIESNYFQYNYLYIGAGVAAGDLNNDGLVDLFFTSNSNSNKLYLNKGDFKFEDISEKAGIINRPGFDTGVTFADVNNDGFLDIYVSRGGWIDTGNRFANMLYINNGDLTFTEKAAEFGLDDSNRTIQAIFFDYDNDNDIDVYVSNAADILSRSQSEAVDLKFLQKDPNTIKLKGSDRLYNNDGTGHFTDVSAQAGIMPETGFGLNPEVLDVNNDGFLDIYVNNDFNIPDFAYLNNGDGTFTESRNELFKHMSFNSMGGDAADINNDGLIDLMTLDMNPEDYIRSKTTMGMTSVEQFEKMVAADYHYQYMHNMLHVNNGNGTFSEISKMAGMANTDWSWSLLSADFDLDGLNDIYVTNGVFRDVIDKDKHNEILGILRSNQRKPTPEDFLRFSKMLPQQKLVNYFFRNNGDLTFEDTTEKWADTKPTFSNGAAYADFDNDGDLDIVVNNINDEATLLRNKAVDLEIGNHLEVVFSGPEKNKFGLGGIAKVHLTDGTVLTRQMANTRGFLSAVPNSLHFGLAKNARIEMVEIKWLDGKGQRLEDVSPNQVLKIDYANATDLSDIDEKQAPTETLFTKIESNYVHNDPYFNDYNLQILLPHKLSQTGPAIAKGDINNDGLEDVFLGGGHGQAGQLLIGRQSGDFQLKKILDFETDRQSEDVGAAFFDADNDGDQDLYVVSGSYEFMDNPRLLIDRLYINNGEGGFTKSTNIIPEIGLAGSVVVPTDYDNDGDMDLFVGGRIITGKYPHPASSLLLINDKGAFSVGNDQLAPGLNGIGLVTDAVWIDINNDAAPDLMVTGEWMGVHIFLNENNRLVESDAYPSLTNAVGWWNRLLVEDIDNDGDMDIVAGNLGLNYKFHASPEKPFEVYASDFDYNGSEDVILAKEYQGRQVPVRGKSCMTQQLPHLAQKIPTYTDFANKDIAGIVGQGIETALHYQATEFRSGIFYNTGDAGFSFTPFGNNVQQSPINGILFEDFDKDGYKDLLLVGNNYQSEVETTKADAGIGSFLKGSNSGEFKYVPNLEIGFFADKDVRNMVVVNSGNDRTVFVANNNDNHDLFKVSVKNN